ncbi:MAG: hypothetical protein AAF517_20835 [Planctomycetota bacterium]
MKEAFLSSFVSAAIVAGVMVALNDGGGEASSSSRDAEAVIALDQRVTKIEESLESISKLEASIEGLRSQVAQAPKGSLAKMARAGIRAVKNKSSGEGSELAAQLAEQLGSDDSEKLREFVASVIDEQRESRTRAREEKALERVRDLRNMNKGPYGEHNYKINTLAKQLDLDDRQKEHVYNTLVDFKARLTEARKNRDRSNPESVANYKLIKAELQTGFENAIAQGLSQEQADQFQSMHSWEKGIDSNVVFQSFSSGDGSGHEIHFEASSSSPVTGSSEFGSAMQKVIQSAISKAAGGDIAVDGVESAIILDSQTIEIDGADVGVEVETPEDPEGN